MTAKKSVIPIERIESQIYLLRGQKVMFDNDLAGLYGVATKVLIQAVKRNVEGQNRDIRQAQERWARYKAGKR